LVWLLISLKSIVKDDMYCKMIQENNFISLNYIKKCIIYTKKDNSRWSCNKVEVVCLWKEKKISVMVNQDNTKTNVNRNISPGSGRAHIVVGLNQWKWVYKFTKFKVVEQCLMSQKINRLCKAILTFLFKIIHIDIKERFSYFIFTSMKIKSTRRQ
jgi:hypothetical protein